MMSIKSAYPIITALSVVGIFLALYLLWQQLYRPEFQPCSINSVVNCDAIISGPVAKTLGLPTPLYGLIGYTLIFISAYFYKTKLLRSVALFGLLFCLWIGYKELVVLRVICPICIACQGIMISVFTLAYVSKKEDL